MYVNERSGRGLINGKYLYVLPIWGDRVSPVLRRQVYEVLLERNLIPFSLDMTTQLTRTTKYSIELFLLQNFLDDCIDLV